MALLARILSGGVQTHLHTTFSCKARALSVGAIVASPSRFIIRTPSPDAPREAPTPLVFLSASEWDRMSQQGMTAFASMLAQKGFTCIESDLVLPERQAEESSELMHHFETELRNYMRLTGIPFPPVIFARTAATVIAQTYVSSNPATGLFLISPPASNSSVPRSLLPTPLNEFDFELKFPLAIMSTPDEMKVLQESSRLGKDPGVDKISVENVEGQEALAKVEQWLDEIGV